MHFCGIIQSNKSGLALPLTAEARLDHERWTSMSDFTTNPRPWYPVFLKALGEYHQVAKAARLAGIVRDTAYFARQRDPVFAQAWRDAMVKQSPRALISGSRSIQHARSALVKGDYYEADLTMMIASKASMLSMHMHWPDIVSVCQSYELPNLTRIDLLLCHNDGSATIVEVKTCARGATTAPARILYASIGQLLYYFEGLRDDHRFTIAPIRMCLATDFDPDVHFSRASQHITPPIEYCNVMEFLHNDRTDYHHRKALAAEVS